MKVSVFLWVVMISQLVWLLFILADIVPEAAFVSGELLITAACIALDLVIDWLRDGKKHTDDTVLDEHYETLK